jgi:transporter family-2 protein
MTLCIILALINGMVIGISRAMNGQLSMSAGPFQASLWNHAVGFLFLSLILLVLGGAHAGYATLPAGACLGGFFGALFVAVNSFVFNRLGAMRAALLVIGGQMLFAVLIDWQRQQQVPGMLRCLGVLLMLLGMYLSSASKALRVRA